MKTIILDEHLGKDEIKQAIRKDDNFKVLVKGNQARALNKVLPEDNSDEVLLSPAIVWSIYAFITFSAITGITFYAMSVGYKVIVSKRDLTKNEVELEFRPEKKS